MSQPAEARDFVEWRRGRTYFSVWAIDLDFPDILQAASEVRASCPDVWLPGFRRQPHLTLHVCGFPAPARRQTDDFVAADLDGQVERLKTSHPRPFGLLIGLPGTFASAAYLSLQAPAPGIDALHALLGPEIEGHRAETYRPHVTIGLYREALPLDGLRQQMQAAWRRQPLEIEVVKLAWMRYRASEIGGGLQTVGEFDLRTGDWQESEVGLLRSTFSGE